jgi:hypothetical protein
LRHDIGARRRWRSGGRVALALLDWPNGKQDVGDHSHAENDNGDPGHVDDESPSWVK